MTNALDLVDDWGPEKVVVVSHRRTGMKGVLVIDNTTRGMGKGGTRMAPTVTVTEIARLARNMTWKWAGVDLFYGGAKAGIVADPASPDKEAILRAFARAVSNEVPREYVLGLDMGLTEDDAAIVQDELGDRGSAVGTPAHLGGIAYDQLGVTGYGVAEAAEAADAAAQHQQLPLAGARVAIQGFGAVGSAAATRLTELGASIVAVSTEHGALHDPAGLDVSVLTKARAEHGDQFVTRTGSGKPLPAGEEITVDCDVLVPAALQDVVDEANAHQIKARLVVEGRTCRPRRPPRPSSPSVASPSSPTSSPTPEGSSRPRSPWTRATRVSAPTPARCSPASPPVCSPTPTPSSSMPSETAAHRTRPDGGSPRTGSATR